MSRMDSREQHDGVKQRAWGGRLLRRETFEVRVEDDEDGLNAVEEQVDEEAGQELAGARGDRREDETEQEDRPDDAEVRPVLRDVYRGEDEEHDRHRADRPDEAREGGVEQAAEDDLLDERGGERGGEGGRQRRRPRAFDEAVEGGFGVAGELDDAPPGDQQRDRQPGAPPKREARVRLPAERLKKGVLAKPRHQHPREAEREQVCRDDGGDLEEDRGQVFRRELAEGLGRERDTAPHGVGEQEDHLHYGHQDETQDADAQRAGYSPRRVVGVDDALRRRLRR